MRWLRVLRTLLAYIVLPPRSKAARHEVTSHDSLGRVILVIVALWGLVPVVTSALSAHDAIRSSSMEAFALLVAIFLLIPYGGVVTALYVFLWVGKASCFEKLRTFESFGVMAVLTGAGIIAASAAFATLVSADVSICTSVNSACAIDDRQGVKAWLIEKNRDARLLWSTAWVGACIALNGTSALLARAGQLLLMAQDSRRNVPSG